MKCARLPTKMEKKWRKSEPSMVWVVHACQPQAEAMIQTLHRTIAYCIAQLHAGRDRRKSSVPVAGKYHDDDTYCASSPSKLLLLPEVVQRGGEAFLSKEGYGACNLALEEIIRVHDGITCAVEHSTAILRRVFNMRSDCSRRLSPALQARQYDSKNHCREMKTQAEVPPRGKSPWRRN